MRVCVGGGDSCIAMKEEEVSKKLCYVRPSVRRIPGWQSSGPQKGGTKPEEKTAQLTSERIDAAQLVSLNSVLQPTVPTVKNSCQIATVKTVSASFLVCSCMPIVAVELSDREIG